ncbi:MAG TPA: hypothetical protein VG754_06220 [Verrucomicrobiae bacterium]|nr:hypothetical protein [Verrucomicrobiae bacterium]
MKKSLTMVLYAGLCVALTGCVCVPDRCHNDYVTYYAPSPPPAVWYAQPTYSSHRAWYRVRHRLWDDGYSFSNDPANHDVLAPVLGLDIYFPPAPQPYVAIDQ